MTLNEMLEKRKNLLNTMDGFLETHKNSNGALSVEDDATYSKMEKEFDELTASITRAQRRANMEMEMNKPVNAPITAKPMVMTEPEDSTGRASKGYKKNFWNASAGSCWPRRRNFKARWITLTMSRGSMTMYFPGKYPMSAP